MQILQLNNPSYNMHFSNCLMFNYIVSTQHSHAICRGALQLQRGSSEWGTEVAEILSRGISRPKSGHDAGMFYFLLILFLYYFFLS